MSFSVSRRAQGMVIRVEVAGEVDAATCGLLVGSLHSATSVRPGYRVIVDLGKTTFLDASGVEALLRGGRGAARRGVDYCIVNAQAIVRTVLDHCGVPVGSG